MLAGHGVDLDRSTLVRWIERAVWWLQPLHALLISTVMSAPKVFCDDTPLPVLDRTRRRTRIGRLWCYAVDDRPWQGPAKPAVVFRYAEGTNPNGSINDIAGIINEQGNVLGLMPHPENLIEAAHGGSDGRALFEGALGIAA